MKYFFLQNCDAIEYFGQFYSNLLYKYYVYVSF